MKPYGAVSLTFKGVGGCDVKEICFLIQKHSTSP